YTLTNYLSANSQYWCGGNSNYIAKSLASTSTLWNTYTVTCTVGNDLSVNNSTGFSALPGGYCNYAGSFDYLSERGYWWSSTEKSASEAYYRLMYYNSSNVGRTSFDKRSGLSVRCLCD